MQNPNLLLLSCLHKHLELEHLEIDSLTIICLLVIGILKGFLQLLCLAPQTEALEHLSGTVPLLLAAVLCYHLFLDVLELLIGEVLHEHRLKHLQCISLVYKQLATLQFIGL